jgi:hypothetical protein
MIRGSVILVVSLRCKQDTDPVSKQKKSSSKPLIEDLRVDSKLKLL